MQEAVVALIVLLALVAVLRQYGPRRWRATIGRHQAGLLRRLGLRAQAARVERACGCHDGAISVEALKRTAPRRR